jgi:hypothetical protein
MCEELRRGSRESGRLVKSHTTCRAGQERPALQTERQDVGDYLFCRLPSRYPLGLEFMTGMGILRPRNELGQESRAPGQKRCRKATFFDAFKTI